MERNVLYYLDNAAQAYPDKPAVQDEQKSYTYQQVQEISRRLGTALCGRVSAGQAVGVYMEKCADAVCAFLGIAAAGGFYSVLNNELPPQRLNQICAVLEPALILTSRELEEKARELFPDRQIEVYEELLETQPDMQKLSAVRARAVDTNPLYVNFTSGSTGTPKGIVVAHRSVIDFIDCFTELFHITSQDIIANQAPFDFDVSVKDIYSALRTGATLVVVPRRMFSAPVELTDFLCDRRVTTMIWAVSALCLLTTFHALEYRVPETVSKIIYSGEVMPFKALRNFQKFLPKATIINVYGPTEITCNCTYHILQEGRDYSGGVPIGRPFPNEDVFLLDENNCKVTEADAVGEICVRGTALALGYYKNPEQNAAHFVQNPLNPCYPELIYRTGDLGRYDENGDLVFSGRKDFQIKYMGHRIELEEIEREMAAMEGVERCCCLFDEKRSRLKGFYVGAADKDALYAAMREKLPAFMVPGILRQVEEMPLTKNGKIDRKKLEEIAGGRR